MPKKMKVLLVDNQRDEVNTLIRTFATHPAISLDWKDSYAKLGNSATEFVQSVREYDLLILDIYIDDESSAFVSFVNAIAGLKPFIAYTMLSGKHDLVLASGRRNVRDWVASKCGMGVVKKEFKPDGTDPEVEYDLIERIMTFYWSTR